MPTIKELQKEVGKPQKEEHWRERTARWISIRITHVLLIAFPKITPNQITVIMMIVGVLSALFFVSGGYFYSLIGIFFYHLYLILDACDGEVARFKKIFSKKGLYLDYISHIMINPLIIGGIALGAYINNPTSLPDNLFLFMGAIAVYFMFINNFARLKKYEMYLDKGEFERVEKMRGKNKSLDSSKNSFLKEIWEFFRIMTFNSIFFFGILNLLPYLVLINGIIFPLQAMKRLYYEISIEPGPTKINLKK
jgi:phosphatidylglycerophosphate synthase